MPGWKLVYLGTLEGQLYKSPGVEKYLSVDTAPVGACFTRSMSDEDLGDYPHNRMEPGWPLIIKLPGENYFEPDKSEEIDGMGHTRVGAVGEMSVRSIYKMPHNHLHTEQTWELILRAKTADAYGQHPTIYFGQITKGIIHECKYNLYRGVTRTN